ncbi:MAG: N-acetyl-gamma-glutamyl-phosphate reductase [Halobacteriales archaeon]|nr:N-acetyl-gamma-glutamyl-phosphate reductase [Halobacteriales archaeon]
MADDSPAYTASVVGASGFTGGELLRLLDGHPAFSVAQATSRRFANKTVGSVHPNLRHMDLRFSDPETLEPVDVLFAGVPHGVSMERIDDFRAAGDVVVDLSADFRLPDIELFETWYGEHDRPELITEAVYALPELNRDRLPGADFIAVGGCNSTATIIGLLPLFDAGVLTPTADLVVDVKVGSSEGGSGGGEASSHAERSGIVRPYAPTSHRHEAEIEAYLGASVSFTAHAVDMTRGAAATCHCFPDGDLPEKRELFGAYRDRYGEEPFVRLVAGGGGVYRYPEPKVVAGTNHAEVGFEIDERNGRLVVFSAIDNMMKGSAGQALQATNIALGLEETAGLEFQGLHPVGAP